MLWVRRRHRLRGFEKIVLGTTVANAGGNYPKSGCLSICLTFLVGTMVKQLIIKSPVFRHAFGARNGFVGFWGPSKANLLMHTYSSTRR